MESIKDPTDLCVPIYLDQQIVFDLLAMFENGFSQMNTVNTSTTGTKIVDSKKGASLGSTALSLFDFSLNGNKHKTITSTDNEQQYMEKIHTPSSMFSILRRTLYEKKFISAMDTMDEIDNLKCGDFVEFRSKLKTNPLMDSFNRMREVSKYLIKYSDQIDKRRNSEKTGEAIETKVESIQERDQNKRKSKNPVQNNQVNVPTQDDQNNVALLQWIFELSDDLLNSNSTEIIGNLSDQTLVNVDISAKVNCFVNNDTSLVMNGEFSVFGKVTQVISRDSEDTIDLLQKTNLRSFGEDIIKMFTDAFDQVPNNAITLPKVITKINGPAIQILPIAIFI